MKKNGGFSLMEMIVVVAITGIAIGISVITIANTSSWKTTTAANALDSALSKAMVSSMSRADAAGAIIYREKNTYYCSIVKEDCVNAGNGKYEVTDDRIIDKVELGGYQLTIKINYVALDGSSTQSITLSQEGDDASMTVAAQLLIAHSTGTIAPVIVNGVSCNYDSIEITQKEKTRTLKIYPTTGKYELE